MKKLLSICLLIAMLFSLSLAVPVSAETVPETVSKWDGKLPDTVSPFKTLDGTSTNKGTETNPYIIESASDLANLAKALQSGAATWGKYFSLTCDIDMNGYKWVGLGDKIGTATRFEGIFLGNNHVIYNLQLESGENCGFFNLTHCASVYDLGIASGNIDVTYSENAFNVGALIGRAMGGTTISNCFSCADITVSNAGSSYVAKTGLLIGLINTTTSHASKDFKITDCWATGNINVECSNKFVNVAGLIGTKTTNPLFVNDSTVVCNIYRKNGHADDKFGAYVSDNASHCTFTNSSAVINIETNVSPSVIPGAVGKVWSGTVTSSDCLRNITLDVNGEKNVNTTPSFADGCTATADSINITSSIITNNSAQNGVGENSGKIRFVSELMFSAGAFSRAGYIVEFGGKTASIGGSVVYISLRVEGMDEPVTPEKGKYFIAHGISDIPDTVSGVIKVTPFVVLLDGSTFVYGNSASYTLSAGALQ